MSERPDESFHRLLFWTGAFGHAELLAAAVLHAEGYEDIDPIHPGGGPDGKKDALLSKDGLKWIMAVYFPSGPKAFSEIKKKFVDDFAGVAANNVDGMVFVTNQELTESQRDMLMGAVQGRSAIFHVRRVAGVVDRPEMAAVRQRFLALDAPQTAPPRNMREVFDGPRFMTPTPQRHSLYDGMLSLTIGARPVPDIDRHSEASDIRPMLEKVSQAAVTINGVWPRGISRIAADVVDLGWGADSSYCWRVGGWVDSPESLVRTASAWVLFSTAPVLVRINRTWPTMAYDDAGEPAFHAAREPEIVAETITALAMIGAFVAATPEIDQIDVAVCVSAAPAGHMVSSKRAVPGNVFGPVAGRVKNPEHDVPTYHSDSVRFSAAELADPFTVAAKLLGAWLTRFRRDDLIGRLHARLDQQVAAVDITR